LIEGDEPVDGLLGGPLRPSDVIGDATVINVSGSSVEIRYNGNTSVGLITPEAIEVVRKFVEEIAKEVAPGMESFDPENAEHNLGRTYEVNNPGALGSEFEARINERRLAIANDESLPEARRAMARQVRPNIQVDAAGIVLDRQPNQLGSAQLDFVFLKDGYEPTVGQRVDRQSVLIFEVRTSVSGTLTKEKLAIREALSAYPVAVVNSPFRYKLIDGVYAVVKNGRVEATAMFLRRVGGRIARIAPHAGAVGVLVTNISSETWAAEEQILNEMIQMGHLDTENERHTFGEKLMEWYRNRFGDDGMTQLGISLATYGNTDLFESLVDEWNANLPNMYQSTFQ